MITMIVFMLGWMIMLPVCMIYGLVKGLTSKPTTKPTATYQPKKKNPIDKHGDDNYGTIDWLTNGKL